MDRAGLCRIRCSHIRRPIVRRQVAATSCGGRRVRAYQSTCTSHFQSRTRTPASNHYLQVNTYKTPVNNHSLGQLCLMMTSFDIMHSIEGWAAHTHLQHNSPCCWTKCLTLWLGGRGSHRDIAIMFGTKKKLEWCGYLVVRKNLKTCLFVSTASTNVTDRQTAGRTSRDGIGRACAAYAVARQYKNLAIANRSRVSCAHNRSRTFRPNYSVALKPGLRITQGHLEWPLTHISSSRGN